MRNGISYAGPLAAVYLLSLYAWQDAGLPQLGHGALQYIIGAALAQILATTLMVKLFQLQNFAVGAGLAKSEALVAAVLGSLFFGTALTVTGWLGVLVGTVAVFLLSTTAGSKACPSRRCCWGWGAAAPFALTSLWVREASLVLGLPFPHRAAWVLLLVILLQTLLLLAWLLIKDKETLKNSGKGPG